MSKMKVFVMSTVNIKLTSTVGITLMLYIDIITNIFQPKMFNQNSFSPIYFASGHFLDTILTTYGDVHYVILQFDISRMSKSGLLTLYHDID